MTGGLLRHREGAVEVLTLHRPERHNALNVELDEALRTAFAELAEDDQVAAVVLTGAGERTFCSGLDLKDLGGERLAEVPSGGLSFARTMRSRFAKPVVAAVNGAAVGGGCEIALWADLIVSVEHACFALPEPGWGLIAAAGGAVRASLRVPPAIARELVLTGKPLSARRAHQVGMVNHLVPSSELMPFAVDLAATIASHPRLAVSWSRRILDEVEEGRLELAWRSNDEALSAVLHSADATAATGSFSGAASEGTGR